MSSVSMATGKGGGESSRVAACVSGVSAARDLICWRLPCVQVVQSGGKNIEIAVLRRDKGLEV